MDNITLVIVMTIKIGVQPESHTPITEGYMSMNKVHGQLKICKSSYHNKQQYILMVFPSILYHQS